MEWDDYYAGERMFQTPSNSEIAGSDPATLRGHQTSSLKMILRST